MQKALRSLETGRFGLNCDPGEAEFDAVPVEELVRRTAVPTPDRIYQIESALRRGATPERVHAESFIDPWFIDQILQITEERDRLEGIGFAAMTKADWKRAKRHGFADNQLAYLWGVEPEAVRSVRLATGVRVTYKTVDTCAAEFAAQTPYHYGTFEDDDEVAPLTRPAIVILGSGPNRIGQGVEFDYCCVHAAFALSDAGFETVMINCNPETVSTDYDTSDRLFFEPLSAESVRDICDVLDRVSVMEENEGPQVVAAGPASEGARRVRRESGGSGELASATRVVGVVVSLGGQTPLKLAGALQAAGIPILGTSPASIDSAEDREQFNALCDRLGIPQPAGGTAATIEAASAIAAGIGYPVLVRPSYVLGGRAMQIVYDEEQLSRAMAELTAAGSLGREGGLSASRPALIDRFLEDAIEVDVDALRDASGEVLIGGIMEHIEEAGVHSGDSACAIPPPTLSAAVLATIERHTAALATALEVCGLLNVQYAVKDGEVSVIEANPRASRTVPFVSKATGVPLAKVAARVMAGATLAELRVEGLLHDPAVGNHVAVKEAVLPFNKFPEVVLGPEMRSTGEVMGIDRSFGLAFAKSQAGAGNTLPTHGTVFMSLADRDKPAGVTAARRFVDLGLLIAATAGTAAALQAEGVPVDTVVAKVGEEVGVDAVELISSGKVDLVINTPRGSGPRLDGAHIRRAATKHRVPCLTTVSAALAAAAGLGESMTLTPMVRSIQEYHRDGQLRLDLE
jgi:carbamoyl-phosphate synthase large subunit